MVTTKLFDGKVTKAQAAVVGAWYLNLAAVLVVWATTSADLLSAGNLGSIALAFGRLFGLLAATFALTQFLLMGRVAWIEKPFGLDHLASYHRFNGYAAIGFILIHAPFVVLGYALMANVNYFTQYKEVILNYEDVIPAAIAVVLFLTVVAASIYIVRKHLKFETWYYVHLLVYAAIVLAFSHQLAVGGSFQGHPLARMYWLAVYIFVAANVLFWRFGLPTINLLRFKFKVSRVVSETPTTSSLYISGKNLNNWPAKPGKYVLVRFLAKGFIFQEHPFSLSAVPNSDYFRLTIRNSGDYTSKIPQVKPGTPVLVSGPFGRFTSDVALTNKRLFVAGGVGITPLRTLLQEALAAKNDCILLYGNRNLDDVIFKNELATFINKGLKLIPVFSEAPNNFKGESGYINGDRIKRLVPDFAKRDIYICGPQPMMDSVITDLRKTSLLPEQLHYERFALHN
ncbi:ferric reductase-like transmembrane domain-containing protein [Polaromonas sp.]|nr:ferric reductase-like transmembrane domain-containing protein [Candidatus Saccharibacteria bacterium]